MDYNKLTPIVNKPNGWALMPLVVFLCMYLVTSIIVNDFYKVPITVAFLTASIYAVATTKGLSLNDRILQYSSGAANTNIMLMIWIFILAGAFAQSAKAMGAIDATVNLTLWLLPENLLLAGVFLASCFISLSIGTSVGTIVALAPVAAGIAAKTDISMAFMTAIVVGGAFFGDNLSFISDTTIAATRTQGCVMRDKFRVNFLIALPAALLVLVYYIIYGMQTEAHPLSDCIGNFHCGDKCHLGIVAWIAFYRHHRIDIRFIRLVRMVRLYGRRGIRNGRTDYHYPHGWRNAGTDTV